MRSIYVSPQQIAALKIKAATELFSYQRGWINAGAIHRERMITKTRQAGADLTFSFEALIDALVTGRNQYFIFDNIDSAAMQRAYISTLLHTVGVKGASDDKFIFNNSVVIDFIDNDAPLCGKHGNTYFSEFAWADHCDELAHKTRVLSQHQQYRRTFYTTASPSDTAFNLWAGVYDKDSVELSVAHLTEGVEGADGIWRQSVTIENAVKNGCSILDAERLKHHHSEYTYDELFMCEWPQQKEIVKGDQNV